MRKCKPRPTSNSTSADRVAMIGSRPPPQYPAQLLPAKVQRLAHEVAYGVHTCIFFPPKDVINPTYCLWHERLSAEIPFILKSVLSIAHLEAAEVNLVSYLLDSFGNGTRINYGTGHETNFANFLYCLACLDLIKKKDYPGMVTCVFISYLGLMRRLQNTYWHEPAVSHGVWGLDNYHFLPFIFSSAQLIDQKYMKSRFVSFVNKTKKGVFAEHSLMLSAKLHSGVR